MMEICLLNRKRGISVIYNSQLPRTIDVILKDVTNYRYLPQMRKHLDGKYYVHYFMKDLIGRESGEMVFNMPIDVLGSYFDTNFETSDLKSDNSDIPLQKGINLEHDFANAVKKMKGINYVDVISNSGIGSTWKYDVLVYTDNYVYAFDVKGSCKTRVFYEEYGKNFLDKIKNAKKHNAIPYIAFLDNKYKRHGIPNAWFIYKLHENSYLKRLNSHPFYNKLVKNSKKLSNFNFVI